MSKDKHTNPGEFPISEFRTKDYNKALDQITDLFQGQQQFAVSYLNEEIVINYTASPYKR